MILGDPKNNAINDLDDRKRLWVREKSKRYNILHKYISLYFIIKSEIKAKFKHNFRQPNHDHIYQVNPEFFTTLILEKFLR